MEDLIDRVPIAVADPRNPIPMPIVQAAMVLPGEKYGHELVFAKWGDEINLERGALLVRTTEDFKESSFTGITSSKGVYNYPWEIANGIGIRYWGNFNAFIPNGEWSLEQMSIFYATLKTIPSPVVRRALLKLFTNEAELPMYYAYKGVPLLRRGIETFKRTLQTSKDIFRRSREK